MKKNNLIKLTQKNKGKHNPIASIIGMKEKGSKEEERRKE